MPYITITVSGVAKQLSKLNPGKTAGPDNLTSRILKELHNKIALILTDIFDTSFSEGAIPKDWKNAFATPVYKTGLKSKPENYRPISLTYICCKVFEHIITSNIMAHLDRNKLLFPNQHGFRSRVSCETQLIQFSQTHAQSCQVFPKDLYRVHVFSSCISMTCLKVYKAA